jgi:hypothetical protein
MTLCYDDTCVRESRVSECVETCKRKCVTVVEDADTDWPLTVTLRNQITVYLACPAN